MLHQTCQLRDQLIQPVYFFSEKFCMMFFCFFCSSWSLASDKSTWFKTFMSESIVRFKWPDNQCRNLNWKIRSVRERKCSGNIKLAIWLSIQNLYSHFTKVTRKCECFGHIVEPCFVYSLFCDIFHFHCKNNFSSQMYIVHFA